jgi:hypothetical protein
MKRKLIANNLMLFTLFFAFIIGLSFDANAQRRKSKSKRKRAAAVKKKVNKANKKRELASLVIKKGAEDVAVQIKNITKFIFVLGSIAAEIEKIDKDIKAGKASQKIIRKNEEFKSNVVRSVRALRTGLLKLESDFRTNPVLKKYLIHIQGISDQSAKAENFALSGSFRRSGRELLLIVEILADTLAALP